MCAAAIPVVFEVAGWTESSLKFTLDEDTFGVSVEIEETPGDYFVSVSIHRGLYTTLRSSPVTHC